MALQTATCFSGPNMKIRIILIVFLFSLCAGAYGNTPEDVLSEYSSLIGNEQYDSIANLLSPGALAKIKAVFDEALTHEIDNGKAQLQVRIFNRKVNRQEVAATPADLYLSRLMRKLVTSTQMQGVKFERVEVVGRVDETAEQAHLLVRVFMSQHDADFDNLQVFTFTRTEGNWSMEIPVMIKQLLEIIHHSTQR